MFKADFFSSIGDDLSYPLKYFANEAKKNNIAVSTIDTHSLNEYDLIIFLDLPKLDKDPLTRLIQMNFKNLILFINENAIIHPDNWKMENYSHFRRIYTWNDEIVDNKKIFKFFLPNKIPKNISFDFSNKQKFCCMIASNKYSTHPLELYTERIRAIRWFELNYPNLFDLYGQGWSELTFKGLLKPLNMSQKVRRIFSPKYPSYRGPIKNKHDVLSKYKFSICFENAKNFPGYITEKIFDCFFAGCIPIYFGAPNISDHIPKECFIDMRDFPNYSNLFSYLINLSDDDYQKYLIAIQNFIQSESIMQFSAQNYSQLIMDLVMDISSK